MFSSNKPLRVTWVVAFSSMLLACSVKGYHGSSVDNEATFLFPDSSLKVGDNYLRLLSVDGFTFDRTNYSVHVKPGSNVKVKVICGIGGVGVLTKGIAGLQVHDFILDVEPETEYTFQVGKIEFSYHEYQNKAGLAKVPSGCTVTRNGELITTSIDQYHTNKFRGTDEYYRALAAGFNLYG